MAITHTFKGSCRKGFGYYAYIEDEELVIGENWPREGGETYRGSYANAYRALRNLEKEAPALFKSITEYYAKHQKAGQVRSAEQLKPGTKSFREQLTEKVEFLNYDITEHIESIKRTMQEYVQTREFTVSLIQQKPNTVIALGSSNSNIYQTFIPYGIEPATYLKLFRSALEELGFEPQLGAGESIDYYFYNLNVRW
jgi:hypothetical protein